MQSLAFDLSPEGERVPGFLLWQVSKLWQRRLNSALKDLKLTSTQAVILANVVRSTQQGNNVTQIMLSQLTKVDVMTASTAIRSLEQKGLVIRKVPSNNKRSYAIKPTQKGERVALVVLQRFVQAHVDFFSSLEQSVDGFVDNLQTLKQTNNI
ncbi:MAG TPA: MarR family transcriptional regulator [Candidatus Saccharimonadia bacterium]|nr:MarR family transcriptional regulator [Candidatus Saccharimonadia bacterium]